MGGVWSREKAWKWYNEHTWIRGCNFMGSDCANRIDQWQELGFEERLQTADAELKLAAETGFNAIRIILEFIVWDQQHDGFMERLEDTFRPHGNTEFPAWSFSATTACPRRMNSGSR